METWQHERVSRSAKLRRNTYRAARIMGDVEAVETGHAGRRVKNRALGRMLGRGGVWRRLWR
jgi:hypothetical protein